MKTSEQFYEGLKALKNDLINAINNHIDRLGGEVKIDIMDANLNEIEAVKKDTFVRDTEDEFWNYTMQDADTEDLMHVLALLEDEPENSDQ